MRHVTNPTNQAAFYRRNATTPRLSAKPAAAGLAAILAAAVISSARPAAAATLYVKTTGSGTACSSWANACTLSQALTNAASGDSIWVKSGTYSGPVALTNGVKLIGGFAGTETAASQSNPSTNATIIDGGSSASPR